MIQGASRYNAQMAARERQTKLASNTLSGGTHSTAGASTAPG
jgi:hypothetical protein